MVLQGPKVYYFVNGVHCCLLKCPICNNIFCVSPQSLMEPSDDNRKIACTWCEYTDIIYNFKGRIDK